MTMDYKELLNKVAHKEFVQDRNDFMTSFRANQISSKEMLVNAICDSINAEELEHVAVLGSWNSVLLYELLSSRIKVNHWHFFDIDEKVHQDRDIYFSANNMDKNYTSYTKNVNKLFDDPGYHAMFDMIINPSAEHMYDLKPAYGPVYALCSNNYRTIEGQHINCVDSSKELQKKNGIETLFHRSTKDFGLYMRYCVIGLR
jgi:hypothetical protein